MFAAGPKSLPPPSRVASLPPLLPTGCMFVCDLPETDPLVRCTAVEHRLHRLEEVTPPPRRRIRVLLHPGMAPQRDFGGGVRGVGHACKSAPPPASVVLT